MDATSVSPFMNMQFGANFLFPCASLRLKTEEGIDVAKKVREIDNFLSKKGN